MSGRARLRRTVARGCFQSAVPSDRAASRCTGIALADTPRRPFNGAARREEPRRMPKAKDVIGYAHDKKAVMIDLKFMDFLGLWQHFTIPLAELTEAVFEEGLGFDGSSIRGWMPIHNSDMLVVPDADTGTMDPFMKDPTLSIICNIVDPITRDPYSRDPRFVAQKAEKYLKASGVGDAAYFGPEAEFFIFDGISYDSGVNHASYRIESRECFFNDTPPTEKY